MLSIENLSFKYSKKGGYVVEDFNFSLAPGGIYGLLGENGVGKSTLLYLIAGLLTPESGHVYYNGADTRLRLPSTLSDIFIVPEVITLPSMSLKDYVKINAPLYPRFSQDDLDRHLATFGLPQDIFLGKLSMGQTKKAYMSFALACNTSLLLMDEPTNGLDIPGKAAFRSFIASNMTDEKIIIISTHQVRDVNLLLDHVMLVHQGQKPIIASIAELAAGIEFGVAATAKDVPQGALFTQPTLQGIQYAAENLTGAETEVDLEMMFNVSMNHPEWMRAKFSQPQNKQS